MASVKRCPTCNKATVPDYAPFCSKRCADIDLGKWFNESYSIAGEETVSPESDHYGDEQE